MICTLPHRPSSQWYLPIRILDITDQTSGPGDRNPSKVLGSMGDFLRKRDPIRVASRSIGGFSHQLCPSQNELWASRKSRFQATGLGTQSSSVFSNKPWTTVQIRSQDWDVCCHPAVPSQAHGTNKSHSSLHVGRTHFFLSPHHIVIRLPKSPDSHSRPVPLCEPRKHGAGGSNSGWLGSRTKSHSSCV